MKLVKNTYRFSDTHKPVVGSKCILSIAKQLTQTIYQEVERVLVPFQLKGGLRCEVTSNLKYLTEVQFAHKDTTDLVSPCFLIKRDLTVAGLRALEAVKMILSSRERKVNK
ncbi:hypothetical protein LCGC14_2121770 [marine sediment metagenome]|uniref:Uncharacterized protein n=1 Tax=marine sediment metagenome TaxID=412755 RepID=A0A0F9E446_9ZZZZ